MLSGFFSVRKAPERRTWRQRIRRWVLLFAVTPYVVVLTLFVLMQRQLMYQPDVAEQLSVVEAGLSAGQARDVEIHSDDGETLRGWLINAADQEESVGNAPLVVYFPGNSQNRSRRLNDLLEFSRCGFDVLIFDYRGYGDSTGFPSEAALTEDARLVWQFACRDLARHEQNIVVFGESLGGAVALSLWSDMGQLQPRPAAVLLNSTFTSMPETVAWHYPAFPFRYFVLDRWPSIDRIGRVKAPITVFHGTADEIIPVSHGRRLADAAADGTFIEIPDATHNEIPSMQLRTQLRTLKATLLAEHQHSDP